MFNYLLAFIAGLALSFGGASLLRDTGPIAVGGLADPFLSIQLSTTTATADFILSTNGKNNIWVANSGGAAASSSIIQVDGTQVNTGVPTLDFDGTNFTLTESPTDDFDVTIANGGITEAKLSLNAPTDNSLLVASSSASGGFEWAATTSPNLNLLTDSDLHNAVTLAGQDFLSLSGQQITANAINEDNININAPTDLYLMVASSSATGAWEWMATSSALLNINGGAPGGGGSGDVTKVGTPADNQVGVWTGDGTIEGDPALTFDTSDNTLYLGANTGSHTIGSQLGVAEMARDANNLLVISAHGASVVPGINAVHSRGTWASPSASQSGDTLYFMGGRGYGATVYNTASRALIAFKATENHTDSANGTEIVFETTANGATSRTYF